MTFPERAYDMLAMANQRGLKAFDPEARHYRFEIPQTMWEAMAVYCADEYGWTMPVRGPGTHSWYRVFGFPFVVDPSLPDDAIRFVQVGQQH